MPKKIDLDRLGYLVSKLSKTWRTEQRTQLNKLTKSFRQYAPGNIKEVRSEMKKAGF